MISDKKCPRKTQCEPISNVVSDDKISFVCIGYHQERKEVKDVFRHCFKTEVTDSMFDYNEYDLKSVISVMSEALLIEELTQGICRCIKDD